MIIEVSPVSFVTSSITKLVEVRSNRYAFEVEKKPTKNWEKKHRKISFYVERSPLGPELSIVNQTQYEVQQGEVVELPCGIGSISSTTRISWRKEGKELFNVQDRIYNHSLILHGSAEDSGNYFCQVDDESIGQLTSMMSLKVHGIDIVLFVPNRFSHCVSLLLLEVPILCQMKTKQNEIVAKTTFELICSTNDVDESTNSWIWFHNSVRLISETTDRLKISNASRQHIGMYQCCRQNCCDQIQIRVISKIRFWIWNEKKNFVVLDSSPVIVNENPSMIIASTFPIDFNCTVFADPRPNVEIFRDGRPLNFDREILPSGDVFLRYSIQMTTIDDAGLYECFANNSFGSTSFSTHVNRRDQNPSIRPMKNLFVSPFEQFELFCYASGQPNLRLIWIDTTTGRILNTSNSSPIVWKSVETKSKVLTCRVTNNFGEILSNVSLTIRNPVRIVSVTSNRTLKVRQRFLVHCVAQGDSPLEISLIGPNRNRRPTFDDEKNLTLIIDEVEIKDHGLYQCRVRNNYSEDQQNFHLDVKNFPDRIENLFVENLKKIFWIKPFDGHSPILRYVLRIRFHQGKIWSNETIVFINNSETTNYLFDRITSRCTISLRIQAVNAIGMSLPSDAIQFETRAQGLSCFHFESFHFRRF